MSDPQFDDIIVGGGSAGCVLAHRLSADGNRRAPDSFGHLTMAHPELWSGHVAEFMHELGD